MILYTSNENKATGFACQQAVVDKSSAPNRQHALWFKAHLVGSDLGSWNSVAVKVAVDVGSVTGVGGLDVSGNLDSGRGVARATTSDLDLCARDVELGNSARVVNSKLLDAKEVISCRDLRWDGDGIGGYVGVSDTSPRPQSAQLTCKVPGSLTSREGRANLFDLEPVAGAVCGSCRGGLSHIEGDRS